MAASSCAGTCYRFAKDGRLTMPALEFKGKQHIYEHHLTVPSRAALPFTAK